MDLVVWLIVPGIGAVVGGQYFFGAPNPGSKRVAKKLFKVAVNG
jgi:hypothetical protein